MPEAGISRAVYPEIVAGQDGVGRGLTFSEEDLLAKYMLSYDDTQHGLHFPESSGGDDVYIDGDHWNRWSRSAQRAARDAANSVSYAWDALVNEFLKHAYGGTQYRTTHSELADQEELMRWLACEDRFRRRMLAQSLLEMVRTTPPEHLRRRYYPPVRPGSPYWVFLVLPRLPEYSVDDYRLARQELLLKHLQVVKYLHPDALDLVGIAVDTNMVEMSEDAMFLDARGWTNELNEEARRDYEELGIFANGTTIERRYEEYPVSWWLRRRRNV